ncbi:MAG: ABC transporter permease [Bacteroidales bacterium]|nr:ABC transporter permease [Bacteroidales bacterium]
MLKSFFVLAGRNFFKNGAYSIVNIFGLSVGLAAFILLILFVRFESSYDTFHKDYERIYRVEQMIKTVDDYTSWNHVPAPLSAELEKRYPEVEKAITIREVWGEYFSTSKERTFYEDDGFYANPDIFDLFSINFIKGDKETALDAPMKVVLTESLAKKLFPDSDPMGKNILVDSKRTYQVSGVYKDLPYNTNIRASYFISFGTYLNVKGSNILEFWDWSDSKTFIKLQKSTDVERFENKIKFLLDDFLENRDDEIFIKPIWKVHLQQGTDDGYWIAVLLYATIGLFTLLLAAMNFVNLTTAYSLTRSKEIGVKKVLGSSKLKLMKQFLGESLIIVFISLLVAFTITEAALPLFNRIVSVPLDIKYFEDWQFTLFIIGITTLTGFLSGLYPSIVLSSLNPVSSLKNQLSIGNKFKRFSMRKGLVIFQLVLSMLFILITLGVLGQFKFLENKDLGFDKENLLVATIKETEKVKVNDFLTLRNEIVNSPDVKEVSLSYNSPFYGSSGRTINWEGSQVGEKICCRFNRAYDTYLNTMGIDIISGRDFELERNYDSTACIVNETFVNVIGWSPEEAIGKKVWNSNYIIIGVMKDFHEHTPFNKIQPYILIQHPGYLTGTKTMMFRMQNEYKAEAIENIRTILDDYFPESNFTIGNFDQNKNNQTNTVYLGMVKTFGFFSVVSIVIAIIGLFALVSFSSKRKVKEIGVRKVLGAKSIQIFTVITKEYLKLVIIANIIAIPMGLLVDGRDPSYYKPKPDYSMFIWVGVLSVVVTIATISIQIIKSSRANPVDSLRYE